MYDLRVDIEDGSRSNGALAITSLRLWRPSMQWCLTRVEGLRQTYMIHNANSGKCLDASRSRATIPGAPVAQYGCAKSYRNQWWTFERHGPYGGPAEYRVRNGMSGLCLDVQGAVITGAPLILWTCHEGWNQRWDMPPLQ